MAVQVVQAVQAVHLESDAFLVCLNHALSTEKEEVMGLCIGEVSSAVSLAGTLLSSPSAAPGWVPAAPGTAGATGTPDSDPWTDPPDGPGVRTPFPLCLHASLASRNPPATCISLRVGLVVSLLVCAFLYIWIYHPIDQNRKSGHKDIRA